MKTKIDISSWNRKGHYEFYRQFDEPFFGLTADVDCTGAYEICKSNGYSFYLWYLHKTLAAVNKVEALRRRIEGNKVFLYDKIHAAPTVDRPDGTFGFSFMEYFAEFDAFQKPASEEMKRVREGNDLTPHSSGENVIHFTAIPWVKFTSISHARLFYLEDSVPKIAVGKMTNSGDSRSFPVSIHAHHALADGRDAGEFFRILEEELN